MCILTGAIIAFIQVNFSHVFNYNLFNIIYYNTLTHPHKHQDNLELNKSVAFPPSIHPKRINAFFFTYHQQ